MNPILNNSKNNIYTSKEILNKHIYYKTENNNSFLYYIFTIKSIDLEINSPKITYYTDKCYVFMVPKNNESTAFIYDNYDQVTIKPSDVLYEMSFSEYVNTFREFIKNDGKKVYELPSKIIQDI